MVSKRSRASLLALGLGLSLAAGCTGTEQINAGNFEVAFTVSTTAGNQGFECVLIDIRTFQIEPTDPVSLGILGAAATLGVISSARQNVDFDTAEPCNFVPGNVLPSRVLTSGTYEITQLQLGSILLVDDSTGNFISCGGVRDVAGSFGSPLIFTVGPNEANQVNLSVDVAVLQATMPSGCEAVYDNIASIMTIE